MTMALPAHPRAPARIVLVAALAMALGPGTNAGRARATGRALTEIAPEHRHLEGAEIPLGASARVGPAGASVAAGARHVEVGLAAIGRAGAMVATSAAPPTLASAEVRIARAPGVVEWWRSLDAGLEQGVTIERRALGAGPLVLEMTTGDGVRAREASEGVLVLFDRETDAPLARYADLTVLDAGGALVPSRLSSRDGRIRIEALDERARYPLVVDPLLVVVEEATLLASDAAPEDSFGWSVAITDDGTRAIVGADLDDTPAGVDAGTAHVFVRAGSTWTEEARLAASNAGLGYHFGRAVAISGDGTRVLVGAQDQDVGGTDRAGSAFVFVRAGSTWTEEARFVDPAPGDLDEFGNAVALSGDGTRALVGAARDDTTAGFNAGSARVYVRTLTTWTEETVLRAPGTAADDYFGNAVALAADGTRALVGAYAADVGAFADAGNAYVFVRTLTTWTAEASLAPMSGAANDYFGGDVALSGDGMRAIVAADLDDTPMGANSGSARIFSRVGTTWAEEATLAAAPDTFGSSLALTTDGTFALVGSSSADVGAPNAGAVYAFLRAGSSWFEVHTFSPVGVALDDHFGTALALAADGSRAVMGSYYDDTVAGTNAGSATVFTMAAGTPRGGPCAASSTCVSDHCSDGVCCDVACGAGASGDCEACSAALTGGADGTCAPVTSGATCRAAAGPCDVAETCDGSARTCTADALRASGVGCRAAVGACDTQEVCDGSSVGCPGDALVTAGVVCRSIADLCDLEERCDGLSAACPANAFLPSGASCRAAAGACDAADVCSGSSPACLDAFVAAGTVCNALVTDVCDAPDHCTGLAAVCPAEFLSGVACRASTGACDPAEVCAGSSTACPPQGLVPSGISCRASTDPACDPQESCDGVAASCPADVTSCAVSPDAGTTSDAGAAPDAPTALDAGVTPPIAVTCACRARSRSLPPAPLAALAGPLGLALVVVRSRRRRGARRLAPEGTTCISDLVGRIAGAP